jgi:hypothetical protein
MLKQKGWVDSVLKLLKKNVLVKLNGGGYRCLGEEF